MRQRSRDNPAPIAFGVRTARPARSRSFQPPGRPGLSEFRNEASACSAGADRLGGQELPKSTKLDHARIARTRSAPCRLGGRHQRPDGGRPRPRTGQPGRGATAVEPAACAPRDRAPGRGQCRFPVDQPARACAHHSPQRPARVCDVRPANLRYGERIAGAAGPAAGRGAGYRSQLRHRPGLDQPLLPVEARVHRRPPRCAPARGRVPHAAWRGNAAGGCGPGAGPVRVGHAPGRRRGRQSGPFQ